MLERFNAVSLLELVCGYFDRNTSLNSLDLDFATRVSYDSCLDPCSLVVALIFIERLRTKNPNVFHRLSPNDLYLSSIIIATKFLNDCGLEEYVWNDEWAGVARTSIRRINQLELKFLDGLVSCEVRCRALTVRLFQQWNIMITPDEFDDAVTAIERGVALHSSSSSGFLSYTDINALVTQIKPYTEHLKRFIIASLLVASAYLLLCTLSCGLFWHVQKMVDTSSIVEESQQINETIVTALHERNSSGMGCHKDLANSTKFVEDLESLLTSRDRFGKEIREPVFIDGCSFSNAAGFLDSKNNLNTIVV